MTIASTREMCFFFTSENLQISYGAKSSVLCLIVTYNVVKRPLLYSGSWGSPVFSLIYYEVVVLRFQPGFMVLLLLVDENSFSLYYVHLLEFGVVRLPLFIMELYHPYILL